MFKIFHALFIIKIILKAEKIYFEANLKFPILEVLIDKYKAQKLYNSIFRYKCLKFFSGRERGFLPERKEGENSHD